jgi:hypothetical protein
MVWVVSVTPPTRISPGAKTPGTYWSGGWVGPRAGLNTEAIGKSFCLCRGSNPDRPVVQSVVRLYWLSYPDYLIACYRLKLFPCLINSELDTFLRSTSWYCHWFRFCTSEAAVRLFSSYLLTEMCVQKLVRATARYCVCSCLVWKSDLNLNSWIQSFPTTTIPCVHSCCFVP